MQVRLSFLVLLSALLVLASPAFSAGSSAPSGEGVSPRCEAAIDKAAGRYSQCLLKASANFAKESMARQHGRLGRGLSFIAGRSESLRSIGLPRLLESQERGTS